jgi:hypothetical protein
MSDVIPNYYLVHETPVGLRYAYPRALIGIVQRPSYGVDVSDVEVSEPAGADYALAKDWLVSNAPIVELRSSRPGARVPDGWGKRDHVSTDGPASPDLRAAFDTAPDRPDRADAEHFSEHDAAHACWECLLFASTYALRSVPGEPIVQTERLDGWQPLAGDEDPDPGRTWTVKDPSVLAVYGTHTAHLWPGALSGLREPVIERLRALPLVSVQVWNHQTKVDVEIKVPWEAPRAKTEMHKPYGKRKSVPRTVPVYAMTNRVSVEIPDRLAAKSKAAAIAAFEEVVTREVAKVVPFGENPRGCDHCDGMGWVSGNA